MVRPRAMRAIPGLCAQQVEGRALTRLELEQFTAFTSLKLDLSRGIDVPRPGRR